MVTTDDRCTAVAYSNGWIGQRPRCSKKAIVDRNGKGFCNVHDPIAKEAKRAARQAEEDRIWKIKCDMHAKKEQLAYLEGRTVDAAIALVQRLEAADNNNVLKNMKEGIALQELVHQLRQMHR